MNELGLILLEGVLRATVLAGVGLVAAVVASRRRGPATGALIGSTTLTVLLMVAGLTLSPWPRWWSPGQGGEVPRSGVAPPAQGTVEGLDRPRANPEGPPVAVDSAPAIGWSDFVAEFGRELAQPTSSPPRSPRWRWPAWVACAFLAGFAVALVRLGLGLWAVRTLRDRSRPIDDPALLALVGALRASLSLRREVVVLETSEMATPATVGWRRPVVLFPAAWRGWSDAERRAVLAHELAHIQRGDYLIGLVAQFSLALHFYHPLVHALAGRLRLQQELAADAQGAGLVGGRRPYLSTLANLALRQDPRPVAWPARPFFPTRGTFLRRIEMLRDPKALEQPPMPARGRAIVVIGLVAVGLLVAGLRGPGATDRALAQDPAAPRTPPTPAAPEPSFLDPTSASSDIHFAIDIRPASLLKNPEFKKLVGLIPADGFKEVQAIAAGEIVQILALGFERRQANMPQPSLTPPGMVVVIRSARSYDWKNFISAQVEEVREAGITYLRSGPNCFRVLDDRTLLIGMEADIKVPPIGAARPKGRHGWDDAWKQLAAGPIRAAVDTPWLVRQVQVDRAGANPLMRVISPLLEQTQAYALTLDVADGLTLDALAACGTDDGATRVADTLRALLTLARNSLPDLRLAAERGPGGMARPLIDLVDALDSMLDTARVDQDKATARLHGRTDPAAVATAAQMLVPAVSAARETSRRTQSINNLKQIGLAMHKSVNNMKQIGLAMHYYANHNNSFPPAVLLGPDGKTPYSWRVALLPYLEQAALYNEYKFDEPWDGPNNSKLLERMPSLFHNPSDVDAKPNVPSYYVLTGPDTLFPPGNKGMTFAQITDGTSNTVMVFEAKRDIPWTKPEDIPFDRDKPMPHLGEIHPGGFNTLFGDGSVKFLKQTINPILLRALISPTGGEVISGDAY